ncbi:TPA: hypothetical protein NPW29_005038 [Klebsiella pneumoniae]|nr:hypothetical protein [Klebsiella pneumoniae]
MTDITELAQSLKAAAIDAKELAIIARYSKGRAAAEKFYALANPNNVIALVEVLEKAQQERDNWRTSFDNERFRADKLKAHIDEMTEEQTASINELSRIIQKEVKAKREAEKRIAELESRTVKLPAERFCPAEYAGSQLWSETEVWNKAITACADELRAAGIKVEAE